MEPIPHSMESIPYLGGTDSNREGRSYRYSLIFVRRVL